MNARDRRRFARSVRVEVTGSRLRVVGPHRFGLLASADLDGVGYLVSATERLLSLGGRPAYRYRGTLRALRRWLASAPPSRSAPSP